MRIAPQDKPTNPNNSRPKFLTKFPSFESASHTRDHHAQSNSSTNGSYTEDRISHSKSGSQTYGSSLDKAREALTKEGQIKWLSVRGKSLRQRIPPKTRVDANRS